jgi:TIR domain/WD domain, G-beta repeat
MANAGAGEKLKVFISYSRKDSTAFVDELVLGLEDRGFEPILDRHDIKPGEPWEERLGGLIEQSDTVVFVVSPEAVKSERCDWEIDKTFALSKRLLPVIYKPPDTETPPKLSKLQFVRFDTAPGMMRPLRELADALRADLHWIREHTRLGESATRWERRGRPESLLLRGDEIDAAKTWMAARNAAAPEITDAQRAFVKASEEAETTRLGKERAQLQATARQQKRMAWLLGAVAVLVLAMIGYATWQSYDLARREINVFTARAADALHDEQFDRAMRYALQAYPARGRLPWTTPFSTELEGKLAGGALSSQLHRVLDGHSKAVVRAAFSGDGKRVVTASMDNTARIWDALSGKETAVLGHAGPVRSAAFSGDGKRVVTASEDRTARIWDTESGMEARILKSHDDRVNSAAFSGDGQRVVTASWDGSARIWDAETGTEVRVLKGHASYVYCAAFSGDGQRVVTASEDGSARIWDAETGTQIGVLKGHTGGVISAAFSGDGQRVVTASCLRRDRDRPRRAGPRPCYKGQCWRLMMGLSRLTLVLQTPRSWHQRKSSLSHRNEDGQFADRATLSGWSVQLGSVQDNGTGRIEVAEHRCR